MMEPLNYVNSGVLALLILKEVFRFIRERNGESETAALHLSIGDAVQEGLDRTVVPLIDRQTHILDKQTELLQEIAATQRAERRG